MAVSTLLRRASSSSSTRIARSALPRFFHPIPASPFSIPKLLPPTASSSLFLSTSSSSSSNSYTRQSHRLFPPLAVSSLTVGLGIFIFASDSLPGSTPHFAVSQPFAPYDAPTSLSPSSIPAPASTPSPASTGGSVVTRSGSTITKLKVFVGYDPREDLAYEVCKHSLLKHATMPVEVIPIKQGELRKLGLYTRTRNPTESTEFSFTRFLTPFLTGYEGWALFVDCDFLYTADIRELVEMIDDRYAVMCVQHDYTPVEATKMDGVVQTTYPRKNWSSMVLYNCSHPKNRVLTPAVVNSQSGAFLHRFMWLDDKDIGAVPYTWNFLVGHNELSKGDGSVVLPKAIHYTSGGPWFEAWRNCDFADVWIHERDEYRRTHMIQKIIQDQLISLLDSHMVQRSVQLEERVAALENSLKEVAALQRLLLYYLQDKGLPTPERNGREASFKPEDELRSEERTLPATRNYGREL